MKIVLPTLTLFGSFSTLLCCALPALLVSLGAGAAVAGVVSAFPRLIWLSEHKTMLFIFAGILLAVSALSRHLSKNTPCPAEAGACIKLRRVSTWIFWFSALMYATGFFFAFIARYLFQ